MKLLYQLECGSFGRTAVVTEFLLVGSSVCRTLLSGVVPGAACRRAYRWQPCKRERVVLLLSGPTGLPLSSLSTACIRRQPSSPPDQRDACSSTPCAPARHRRHAPRLSAGIAQTHACFSTPRAHAMHRRPARTRRQGRARAFAEERPRRRAPSRRHVSSPDTRLPPPSLSRGEALANPSVLSVSDGYSYHGR